MQRRKPASRQKISIDSMRLYLREISKIPLLTAEEEHSLARRSKQGDFEARQRLIESNLRFVIKVAKLYRRSGLPLLELINQGNIGLLHAARRFDPDRNIRFTTYAVWWIRQSILYFIAHMSHAFRLPLEDANTMYRARKIYAKAQNNGEERSREMLAAEMGVHTDRLNELLNATGRALSIDEPLREDGSKLGDILEDNGTLSLFEQASSEQLKEKIDECLSMLSANEERVLRLRFGLDDDEPHTLMEIGHRMNVSRERIRQIESQALAKLRRSRSTSVLTHF
jgi:RNA polymerase primary sigma factor